MLDPKTLEKQKKYLIDEKDRLETKIKQLKEFPDYGSNEDDNAKELADFESNQSLEEQLKYLLDKVKKALAAIDKGDYGQCKKCQNAIESGRLEIMPYAELCITCQKAETKR